MNTSVVVPGEASESDISDSETPNSFSGSKLYVSSRGTTVVGEASESDEDAVGSSLKLSPALKVECDRSSQETAATSSDRRQRVSKSKYTSPMHKKLKELNEAMIRDIGFLMKNPYKHSATELKRYTTELQSSLQLMQNISETTRQLTNDLFKLEDKMDIIASCNLLPEIELSRVCYPSPQISTDTMTSPEQS